MNPGAGLLAAVSADVNQPSARNLTRPRRRSACPERSCAGALVRPDLPALLGAPEEQAQNAYGSDGSTASPTTRRSRPPAPPSGSTDTMKPSATYDGSPVAGTTDLRGEAAQAKRGLGHTAVLYSNQTIAISFGGDGANAGPARRHRPQPGLILNWEPGSTRTSKETPTR
ncbi:DUF6215 domain-containing protein [Streptomyces sp. NPDC058534]|uniref:DUF6215 domain-containing protein n=1 Tax=Streptomyces sp. NPDC058534 TaxID=3346541 RepID=UPI0036633E91